MNSKYKKMDVVYLHFGFLQQKCHTEHWSPMKSHIAKRRSRISVENWLAVKVVLELCCIGPLRTYVMPRYVYPVVRRSYLNFNQRLMCCYVKAWGMAVRWNMWRDQRRLIWGSFVSAGVPGGTYRKLLATGLANTLFLLTSPASSCWSQTGGGTININPLPTTSSSSVLCHFIMCCHIYHTLVCYIELNVLW